MDAIILGSVCFDEVQTPAGTGGEKIGGSAIYAGVAAAKFADAGVLGIAGDDFDRSMFSTVGGKRLRAASVGIQRHPVLSLDGVEIRPGKTFRWRAKYEEGMDRRHCTDENFKIMSGTPKIPEAYRDAKYVLLANYDPDVQLEVLRQLNRPAISMADTMDTYINGCREGVERVAEEVDVFIANQEEARLLTGKSSVRGAGIHLIDKYGMCAAIIKCGEHGAYMFLRDSREVFHTPAAPCDHLVDTTGAGDSVAGGFIGYLADFQAKRSDDSRMKIALQWGVTMASFTIEQFGPDALVAASMREIAQRHSSLRQINCLKRW